MPAPPDGVAHKPHFHRNVAWKAPVRAATTTAGTLASSFEDGDTVDGVTLATGDRILVKDQADEAENGLYLVGASGAPTRAYDMDVATEVPGAIVYVLEGTANEGKLFRCTNVVDAEIDVDDIVFAEISGGSGIPETLIDAKGDLIVGSADDTAAKLTVGTNDHVLTADSSATNGVKWAAVPGGGIPATLLDAKGDMIVASADDTAAKLTVGTNGFLLRANSGATNGVEWASQSAAIVFVIDGGGDEIADGVAGFVQVPFACTITAARLLADQSGAIVVDIWKDTYANYPPTDADTITSATPPTIAASGVKSEDTTLTSWTTAISAGDILGFNVDSCTTIERVTVSLTVTRT